MSIVTTNARAYVNHGRWVADCASSCGNAWELEPQQTVSHCNTCGLMQTVQWPADADEIWRALQVRPLPRTRNWFPKDHELALRSGSPHGQTVADLWAETSQNVAEGTPTFWSILKDVEGEVR